MNDLVITPLGTVSPYPNNGKNCPGFLVEYEGYKVLLDCGEGVSGLLNFPNDLNNLIIIISHLHKDHYSGLGGIAYASYCHKNFGDLTNKINVYIPKDNIPDFDYLMNFGHENYFNFIIYNDNNDTLNINHGKINISFKINPHELRTYSVKLEIDDFTICYSGDTGYKNNTLVEFSKNADLLICESTFLKNQIKKNDGHLYTYEAAMIAKEANVGKLLLTHFWPTIDKDLYVDEAKEIFSNTEAAIEGKKLILRRK